MKWCPIYEKTAEHDNFRCHSSYVSTLKKQQNMTTLDVIHVT